MTKKLAILALGLSITTLGTSQVSLELPSEYVNNSTKGGLNTLPDNVVGSPYLTDDFQKGMVYIENEDPYSAMMRYNAYQDEIQVQGSNGITSLFKRDYVWAEINGEKFRIEQYQSKSGTTKGYFVELNEGRTRLLKRYEREFREGQEAASSYSKARPPRFDEKTIYYLAQEGSPAQEIKLNKKDISGILSSPDAATFIKDQKLKLKSEEEVLQLLGHLNSM